MPNGLIDKFGTPLAVLNQIVELEDKVKSLLLAAMVFLVACGGDGDNPFSSGDWKGSRECKGLEEAEVKELWELVKAGDDAPTVLTEEAELNRQHQQLARARKLDCQAWLARND